MKTLQNQIIPLRDKGVQYRELFYFDLKSFKVRLHPTVEDWCNEYLGKWYLKHNYYFDSSIVFDSDADAVAFRLRWLC